MANSLTASAIVLCEGVPFDNSYTDTIDFSSKTEQLNYFGNFSKDGLRFANVSYQHVNYQSSTTRPAMTCRIDKYRGELENVNYLMFQNSAVYSETTSQVGKWYYAFVTQINYINPYCSEIVYELDYFQTYLFEFDFMPSYIEREHPANDNLFTYLERENIELDGYFGVAANNESNRYVRTYNIPYVTMLVSPNLIVLKEDEDSGGFSKLGFSRADEVDGIYCGLYIASWPYTNHSQVNTAIKYFEILGATECIISIIMSPFMVGKGGSAVNATNIDTNILIAPNQLGAHTVRNNKLYNSQFTYFSLRTTTGNEISIAPETMTDCNLSVIESYTLNGNVLIMPHLHTTYDSYSPNMGGDLSYSKGVILNNVNIECPYTALQQLGSIYKWSFNALNNSITGLATMYAGLYTANQGIVQGTQSVFNTGLNQFMKGESNTVSSLQSLAPSLFNVLFDPSTTKYSKSDELLMSNRHFEFYFERYCLNSEALERIDTFFDYYGYQINAIKIPNQYSRARMNYVKSKNPKIVGRIPNIALNTIQNIFVAGVKIWHDQYWETTENWVSGNILTNIEGWGRGNA